MRITIAGTRPQLLKAFAMGYPIVYTGQHWNENMYTSHTEVCGIKCWVDLGAKTSDVRTLFRRIRDFLETQPNIGQVIVPGDTNSALAAAMATLAADRHLIHQEAGARSGQTTVEEVNRICIDRMASERWTVSKICGKNLEAEGLDYIYAGDPLLNMLEDNLEAMAQPTGVVKPFSLLTLHRAENVDEKQTLERLLTEVRLPAVWPVHPRVHKKISEGQFYAPPEIQCIPPANYLEMLWLLKHADHVYTDSGGVQREAMWLKKPLTVLRSATEWLDTDEFKPWEEPCHYQNQHATESRQPNRARRSG